MSTILYKFSHARKMPDTISLSVVSFRTKKNTLIVIRELSFRSLRELLLFQCLEQVKIARPRQFGNRKSRWINNDFI